jgi:hypothetical protein
LFCLSVSFFFPRFSISWVTFSLILSIFILSSFICLFIVFFVSLWCLYSACMVSFICSYAFSNSLFLLSWNFLSVFCTFYLTISSIISIKFSLITQKISSFRLFLWASLGSLA